MPNNDDHATATLVSLGLKRPRDFKTEHDRCVVMHHDAIRRLVERRELVVAAGLHVSMVPDQEGIASLALVSLGEAGFFYIMINPKGRPVGEAPMRFDEEVGKRFVARASGAAGSEDGPVPGRTTRARAGGDGVPSRERERSNAVVVWISQKITANIWTAINVDIEQDQEVHSKASGILRAIGPLANSTNRDSAWLIIKDLPVADGLATVAAELAIAEPLRFMARGLRRLAREINAQLQELGYTRATSSGAGSDAVLTAPAGGTSEEGQVATRTKDAGKKGTTKKGGKKGAAKSNTKTQGEGRRKITEEIAQQAIDMRENGDTWSEVHEATGFTGAQLRPHMAKLQGVDENIAKTPKAIAAARKKGVAWYTIATATGLTVAEAKEKAAEGGADVEGRVYPEAKAKENGGKSSGKKGKKGKKNSPSSEE